MELRPGDYLTNKYQISISDVGVLSRLQCHTTGFMFSSDTPNGQKHIPEITRPVSNLNQDMKIVAIILKEYALTETTRPVKVTLQVETGNNKYNTVNDDFRVSGQQCTDVLMPFCASEVDRVWYKMEDIQMSIIKSIFPQYTIEHYKTGIIRQAVDDIAFWYLPIGNKKDQPKEPICALGFICHQLSRHEENPFRKFAIVYERISYKNDTIDAIKISNNDGENIMKIIEQLMEDQRLDINLNKLALKMISPIPFSVYLKLEIYYCDD